MKTLNKNLSLYKTKQKTIKGLIGHVLNSSTFEQYSSKEIVYSFNKVNNMYPLLTKAEYLLKSFFLSMYSLISKPIYLIRHDKIIIRLFVFLSPRADKHLDTSTFLTPGGNKLRGASTNLFALKTEGGAKSRSLIEQRIKKYLKFKNLRPKTVEILNAQIKLNISESNLSNCLFSLPTLNQSNSLLSLASNGTSKINEGKGSLSAKTSIYLSPGSFDIKRIGMQEGKKSENYSYLSLASNFKKSLEKLSVIFSKIFKKKVEFELIKAQLPFQDSYLISQILGYNAVDNNTYYKMLRKLIPKAVIKNPSKEITPSFAASPYPMLGSLNLLNFNALPSIIINTYALGQENNVKIISPSVSSISKGENTLAKQANVLPGSKLDPWWGLNAKDLNKVFSQPSSYLPPFFYSKNYLKGIESVLFNNSLLPTLRLNLLGKTNGNSASVVIGKKQLLPSYLSGMNVKLAGRIMSEPMRARHTVQSRQEGSLARVKVHFTEKSRFTGKNKRGAFSFTVTISHVLN